MEEGLSRQHMEKLIMELLEACPLCVLATCSGNIPRASTVEFFPSGMTLYILTEGGRKIENIRRNPHVSIAIHGAFTGWSDVRGLQMSGIAEIGGKGSAIFEEGLRAYRRRRNSESALLPGFMNVIRVKPSRIEYLDAALAAKGHAVRQTLVP